MIRKIMILLLALVLAAGCAPRVPAALAAPTSNPTEELPKLIVKTVEATATSVPTVAARNDSDGCDHPFYPVKDGATWTYSYNQAGGMMTYTMSVDENDAFVLQIKTNDGQTSGITIDGQCSSDGIVLMDNLGAATTITDSEGKTVVSTIQSEGVTLPKDIKINDQWSQTIDVVTGDQKSLVHTDFTALGFENITVPAGNFYALKIEQSGYVEVFGQKIKMHGYQWFAEGVGTVKSAMDDSPAAELVSYDIPD